jgi:hypothetical protein
MAQPVPTPRRPPTTSRPNVKAGDGETIGPAGLSRPPTSTASKGGPSILGVLGRDLPAIFRTTAKGYGVSLGIGSADVIEVVDSHAVIRLREM